MDAPVHKRDHGGGLDAAMARYGGSRDQWLDLSTGINPVPYPIGDIPPDAWQRLPDEAAMERLLHAARRFWNVPDSASILAAPGASALIRVLSRTLSHSDMPHLTKPDIEDRTYNEWAAAFELPDYIRYDPGPGIVIRVHPNNPDGRLMDEGLIGSTQLTVIDESFCDTIPDHSHVARSAAPGVVVVKSFGKFWGLAGLRLGFLIGEPNTLGLWDETSSILPTHGYTSASTKEALGPWPVSGPALEIGARALEDHAWADTTRTRLAQDAARLDVLLHPTGAQLIGGTDLFRTYAVPDAAALQDRLAVSHIWTRIFPYSDSWIRFGLPGTEAHWAQLQAAL